MRIPILITLVIWALQCSRANPPTVSVQRVPSGFEISWPSGPAEFYLQETQNLETPVWQDLNADITSDAGSEKTILPLSSSIQFFRLKQWDYLFDGSSLSGFRGYRQAELPGADQWIITDTGELQAVSNASPIHLITRAAYTNFHLRWDWKTVASGNSGLIYRGNETYSNIASAGPEYQLLENGGYPSLQPYLKMGAAYRLFAPSNPIISNIGEWNACEVILQTNRVQHWLNGAKIVDYVIGSPQWITALAAAGGNYNVAGFGNGTGGGGGHLIFLNQTSPTWFRNIRIRPLP